MSTLPTPPESSGKAPVASGSRIVPANYKAAGIVVLAFTALLYLVELVDVILPARLVDGGIQPRSPAGLDGIVWAPLLHDGWGHLFSNTVPVLVFAFLAMAGGIGQWVAITATIWVIGGLGVWLVGPDGVTVGASGLAFGWLAFLLLRGLFNRNFGQLGVAVVLLFIWGGMLWGILPGNTGISWQGHLFGALAGVLAAWLAAKADRSKGKKTGAATTASAPGNLGA